MFRQAWSYLLSYLLNKLGKDNYKLTQHIAGIFPILFLKNTTQKCKQNYSKENKSKQKSSCLDSRCQKMNFKTDWEIYKRIMKTTDIF